MNARRDGSALEGLTFYVRYHWKYRQCLEQTVIVAKKVKVDLEEVRRWSQKEGMTEEFERIKGKLFGI